jgi:hypothetical protein
MTIVLLDEDSDVSDAFEVSFGEWLARWSSCLGGALHAAFESTPLPPRSASAIQRQWRTIESWVRPMYEDWEQQR